MEGQRLILADGTIIEDGRAGLSEGLLWMWWPGWTMIDAVGKAFNPSAIGTIIFQYGDMEDTFVGYTSCVNLSQNMSEITLCMTKG